jgi:hypothetical protein
MCQHNTGTELVSLRADVSRMWLPYDIPLAKIVQIIRCRSIWENRQDQELNQPTQLITLNVCNAA